MSAETQCSLPVKVSLVTDLPSQPQCASNIALIIRKCVSKNQNYKNENAKSELQIQKAIVDDAASSKEL